MFCFERGKALFLLGRCIQGE